MFQNQIDRALQVKRRVNSKNCIESLAFNVRVLLVESVNFQILIEVFLFSILESVQTQQCGGGDVFLYTPTSTFWDLDARESSFY